MNVREAVDTSLVLTEEMSTFYVREMLAHQGSPTAKLRLKMQVGRLAPKLAAYMFTIVGGELRYYGQEDASLSCGCHCEDCHHEGSVTEYEHKPCEHGGNDRRIECHKCYGTATRRDWLTETYYGPCGEQYAGEKNEPDLYGLTNRMRQFISDYGAAQGTGRRDAWLGWWDWQEEGGDVVAMLDEAARMFEKDGWSYGFGGSSWATIAKLTRDYYAGKMNPTTFVDRVWSVEHNGGTAFDKGYGSQTHTLAGLLVEQYENNYDALLRHCDGETVELWRNRNHMADRRIGEAVIPRFHEERDDAWLGVQRTNERVW